MDAHCDVCATYEQAVMAGDATDASEPCDDYEMSEPFKQWMVDRLRDDVMAQINGAGLDRLAIVKDQNKA